MLGRNGASLLSPCGLILALMVSVVGGWTFPQTQDLKGVVVSPKDLPIAGAVCTLRGEGLPPEGMGRGDR